MSKKNKNQMFKPTRGKIILSVVLLVLLGLFSLFCTQLSISQKVDANPNQMNNCGEFFGEFAGVLITFWPVTLILIYLLSSFLVHRLGKNERS